MFECANVMAAEHPVTAYIWHIMEAFDDPLDEVCLKLCQFILKLYQEDTIYEIVDDEEEEGEDGEEGEDVEEDEEEAPILKDGATDEDETQPQKP